MDKEKLGSLLIDYIDNKLPPEERSVVEGMIQHDPDVRRYYEELKEVMSGVDRIQQIDASTRMKMRFDAMLEEVQQESNKNTRIIELKPWIYRAAAAILLLAVGGAIGIIFMRYNDARIDELAQKVELQEQQVKQTREMLAMLGNESSASQRIQGVNVALEMTKPDDRIIEALVQTMNEDPNSNVRLAALEALSRFLNEAQVKNELIRSLAQQKDPVVQIALIQLLVKIKETEVVDDLQNIINDEATIQAVKDEAHTGIMKLS